jgi:hypothetical protein
MSKVLRVRHRGPLVPLYDCFNRTADNCNVIGGCLLRDDDNADEPIGIITPEGITVPESRVVEVIVPADSARVRVISPYGGPNPWKRFPFGERNGSPTLYKVELFDPVVSFCHFLLTGSRKMRSFLCG